MIGLKFRPSVCNLVDIRGLPQVDFQIFCFNPYPRPKSLKIIKHCGNGNQSLIITDNPCLPHICVQILVKEANQSNDSVFVLHKDEKELAGLCPTTSLCSIYQSDRSVSIPLKSCD